MSQKEAWNSMATVYRQQGNWADFVNCQVQKAELPGADLEMTSSVVNTFNSVSANLDQTVRRVFAQRLAASNGAENCARRCYRLLSASLAGVAQRQGGACA
jgi:hypothetical protein